MKFTLVFRKKKMRSGCEFSHGCTFVSYRKSQVCKFSEFARYATLYLYTILQRFRYGTLTRIV